MKKIIFTSTALLTMLAIGACKGAAGPDERWYQAVPNNWQQEEGLDLSNRQITAIPGNFNPPLLEHLDLAHNKIRAIPGDFNPSRLKRLNLANNQITAIPDTLQLNELSELYLRNNNIQEINPKRMLEQFPQLRRINLSGNTDLDERFIQDLRDAAREAGRALEIIAENIAVAPLGFDIKGE